ncbi:hypothetical protein CONPUDRAFT_159174 [Coniophora puteana RWD-64-598 SS2]|uniref:Uncharacterized protein n=1 Tax=Coniophora puteana (strain RWD-64-598) TaxID=741705 RepID=A0A5M3MAS6_CONPW|nr:uncharacterized protein CONPUDRAFT_159174 [Coniophora puteana RWD-64-598 SS2]EIW75741.1 hypothetical protein CONPUDRAFT_159174 [Coniophora puteana RWD-64-598 SS2]
MLVFPVFAKKKARADTASFDRKITQPMVCVMQRPTVPRRQEECPALSVRRPRGQHEDARYWTPLTPVPAVLGITEDLGTAIYISLSTERYVLPRTL